MSTLTRLLQAEAENTGEDWKFKRNGSLVKRLNAGYRSKKSSDSEAVEDAIESIGYVVYDDPELEEDFSKIDIRSAIKQATKLGLLKEKGLWSWEE